MAQKFGYTILIERYIRSKVFKMVSDDRVDTHPVNKVEHHAVIYNPCVHL